MAIIDADYLNRYAIHGLYSRSITGLLNSFRLGQTICFVSMETPGTVTLNMEPDIGFSYGRHQGTQLLWGKDVEKSYPIPEDNTADWKKPVHKRQKVKPGKPSPLIAALTKKL